MDSKYCILLCVLFVTNNAFGFVKRDLTQTSKPNILDSIGRNVNRIRECLDQSLATAVSEVDEKQLQPIFSALGDQLNRFTKAFEILTSPQSTLHAK